MAEEDTVPAPEESAPEEKRARTVPTPEEIGGQITEDDVKVLHLVGDYRGMVIAHKKDDPILAEHPDGGMTDEGVDFGGEGGGEESPVELTGTFCEGDGTTPLNTSPASYPHLFRIRMSGTPSAKPMSADVVINDGEAVGSSVTADGSDLLLDVGSFESAGTYTFAVTLDTGDACVA